MLRASCSARSMDSLIFHACLVLLVMLMGYVLRIPFVELEERPSLRQIRRKGAS